MARHSLLIVSGVLYLAAFAVCGLIEFRSESREKSKDSENEKKKPNILKDYVCLRDGELCHPDFAKNRGMYVSCSNGIAWEQQCPKCVYHALSCPTKSLWFDGEKCEWASPKLASTPCIDRVHLNSSSDREGQTFFQNLETLAPGEGYPPYHQEKNRYPAKPPQQIFKSPKFGTMYIDANLLRDKERDYESEHLKMITEMEEENQKKVSEDSVHDDQPAFPTFSMETEQLDTDNSAPAPVQGSKIIRLNEPVYTLVDAENGSGKQVLMRVAEPFVLEDNSVGVVGPLPNPNIISAEEDKKDKDI